MRGKFSRNTRQRRVILEELCKLTSHPTATDLYEIVRRRMPKLSLGTVYRNLDRMAEMGVIRRLEFSGGETRFDGRIERHEHIRCIRCGRVDDIEAVSVDLSVDTQRSPDGYEIIEYRVELLGICPRCRGRPAAGEDVPSTPQESG